jgi:DNA repair protein RadC
MSIENEERVDEQSIKNEKKPKKHTRSSRYFKTIPNGTYEITRRITKEEVVTLARHVIEQQFQELNTIQSPNDTRSYLVFQLAQYDREVFCCIFLDTRHRVLGFEKLFYGTIDGASVHPREVLKRALAHNAAAIICAHNHPSGLPEPSSSDQRLTQRLKDALALIDVRLVDHVVVGGTETISFAERGLL